MNILKMKATTPMCAIQQRGVLGVLMVSAFLTGCAGFGDASNTASDEGLYRSGAASSQSDDRLTRTVYAATGLGLSRLEPDTSEVSGSDVNDRVNAGGQITLGADLTKHLSLELHSADLGSAGISPTGRINYHMHGASALIYAGKNRHNFKRRGFSGYGRLGYGLLENSPVGDVNFVKDNASHVLVGAGLEYMTRIGLGLRGEVISYEEDVLYGQLGLIYRLGRQPQRRIAQIVKAPTPEVVAPVAAVKIPEPVVVPEPVAALPDPCAQFNGALDGINFHTDSAELQAGAKVILNGVANTLSQCETPVKISAHTDSRGSAEYNQALSAKRAASVVRYLSEQGIEPSRLSARAYGESQPIDSNETKEGRLRNRRVELIAQ